VSSDTSVDEKRQESIDLKAKIAQFGLVAETDVKLKKVQEELAEAKASLEKWTQAEAAWTSQRRLFKVMTESVSDLIVLLDAKGHRTWNNPAYTHALGYPPTELAGTYALAEVHPEDKDRAIAALEQAKTLRVPQQAEYRMRRKDGTWIDLQTEIVPVAGADEQIESLVLMAHDVTRLKKLEESQALSASHATQAAIVEANSRELEQILTTAFGNIAIARNLNGANSAVAGRLAEIERSLQQAREIVEQTFTLAGRGGHAKSRQALQPIVREITDSVMAGTFIRIEYNFPNDLPEIEVDPEGFSQVLRNVLSNSVQAMDKGLIRISAEYISRSQLAQHPEIPLRPGGYICLMVRDQGHGMTERTLLHAFEPYFTTRAGSQGLGLTTALATMQRMGGTLLLDSAEYAGTTAYLYLPTAPVAGATRTGTLPLPVPEARKRRVLLMDDEQMILDIVSRMLTHLGYEVSTCTDGAQAIAAFAKGKMKGESFDVVLMDLVVPSGVGGQDAVHTIRKIDGTAKVIASSGHLEHPVMSNPKKFGFAAVLEKPYRLETLRQVISSVVEA
jgi:PAS domain S-box-containing protein